MLLLLLYLQRKIIISIMRLDYRRTNVVESKMNNHNPADKLATLRHGSSSRGS